MRESSTAVTSKTQQQCSSGREKRGGRKRRIEGGRQEERRQLGCRWVQTLCILPDNDGRRGEAMQEDGGRMGKRERRERECDQQREKMCVLERKTDSGGEESEG